MTKREVLGEQANRLDRIAIELDALAHMMSLYDSHEAAVTVACIRMDAKRIRRLAERPLMANEADFLDPA